MQQNIVIYITIQKFLGVISTITVATWYAAFRLSRVETKVDFCDVRLANLEGRLDKSFAGASPIQLLERGRMILNDGLKEYIDTNKDSLLATCRSYNNLKNQYDMQEAVFKFFNNYNFRDFESTIKSLAFKYGISAESTRRIAAIYFRDICLAEHGFKPGDLDTPKIA